MKVVVGTGDETKSWTLPVALLTYHSEYLRVTLCDNIKRETQTTNKLTLAERPASIFAIFVQWLYTDTIPKRFDLSRLSTGNAVSNSFQLWTLSDYLQAEEFKTRIMSELYASYSLNRYLDGFDFMELSAAEVDYCWTSTNEGAKLRVFLLDILSHHITFGDYICVEAENEWHKTFIKHADLQMQLLARIAASNNTFSFDVAVIPALDKYLEAAETNAAEKVDEATKL